MRLRRVVRPAAMVMLAGLISVSLAACGEDDDSGDEATPSASGSGDKDEKGEATVSIEMKDYAFAVSGAMAEGGSIEFSNTGKEYHMTGFGKLKDGKTIKDVTDALDEQSGPPEGGEEGGEEGASGEIARSEHGSSTSTSAASGGGDDEGEGEEEEEDPFADILDEVDYPGSIAEPGGQVTLSAGNLDAGDYALICYFGTEGGGPPHFAKGMVGEFKVVEGGEPEELTAAATYEVDKTGKITGPATLKAGEQTLEFTPGDDAEVGVIFVKPTAGKTFKDMDEAFTKVFESEEGTPKNARSQIPGSIVFATFDLVDVEGFTATVDLAPGTYYLVADTGEGEEEGKAKPDPPTLKVTVS